MAITFSPNALTVSVLALAAAALSACSAQSYGHGAAFAGENCNAAISQACGGRYSHGIYNQGAYGSQSAEGYGAYGAQSVGKTRYGTSYQMAGYDEQLYAQQFYMQQQQMMLRPAPYAQPSYSYQTASTSYQEPIIQEPSYNVELFDQASAAPANCPAGTTAQSDGSCLQGSSLSYSSVITSNPSYSDGYVTGGTAQNCPSGTSASSDGSCLMGGTSSNSSTYTSSTSDRGVAPAIGTYDWGSRDTTWGSDSYVSPGSRAVDAPNSYPAAPTNQGYMPRRK